jgi:drug/metabolite transporter superfamily protein YnfA
MTHQLLGIPLIIWGLQLLYVALALLLFALLHALHSGTSHLRVQIAYVIVMVIINIFWRVAIRKIRPEWF